MWCRSEGLEPPEDKVIAYCAVCNGEIYDYEEWEEDEDGKLIHSGIDRCK